MCKICQLIQESKYFLADLSDYNKNEEPGGRLVSARRPEEGLPFFEQALAIDGTYRNALYNKGLALVQLGRTEEGLSAWETLLREYPDDPQLQGLRGQIDRLRRDAAGGTGR